MEARLETLKQRLEAFQFDEDGTVDRFRVRLARENGWTSDYAARVVKEYERFLLLAVTAEHSVTPPDAVDQVWHLHLTYSDSYWNRLCPEVLGRPLHHHPSKGGPGARQTYMLDYAQTLESYGRVFGEPPPADIWPAPAVRFGRDLRWLRVNLTDHWVLPRRSVRIAAVVSAAVLGLACIEALSRNERLGLLLLAYAIAAILVAWRSRSPSDETQRGAAPPTLTRSREQPPVSDASAGVLAMISVGVAGVGLAESGGNDENAAAGAADGGESGGDGTGSDGCGSGGCGGCGGCGCG